MKPTRGRRKLAFDAQFHVRLPSEVAGLVRAAHKKMRESFPRLKISDTFSYLLRRGLDDEEPVNVPEPEPSKAG